MGLYIRVRGAEGVERVGFALARLAGEGWGLLLSFASCISQQDAPVFPRGRSSLSPAAYAGEGLTVRCRPSPGSRPRRPCRW